MLLEISREAYDRSRRSVDSLENYKPPYEGIAPPSITGDVEARLGRWLERPAHCAFIHARNQGRLHRSSEVQRPEVAGKKSQKRDRDDGVGGMTGTEGSSVRGDRLLCSLA